MRAGRMNTGRSKIAGEFPREGLTTSIRVVYYCHAATAARRDEMVTSEMIHDALKYTSNFHTETAVSTVDENSIRIAVTGVNFFTAVEVKYSDTRGLIFKMLPLGGSSFMSSEQLAKVAQITSEITLNFETIKLRGSVYA